MFRICVLFVDCRYKLDSLLCFIGECGKIEALFEENRVSVCGSWSVCLHQTEPLFWGEFMCSLETG